MSQLLELNRLEGETLKSIELKDNVLVIIFENGATFRIFDLKSVDYKKGHSAYIVECQTTFRENGIVPTAAGAIFKTADLSECKISKRGVLFARVYINYGDAGVCVATFNTGSYIKLETSYMEIKCVNAFGRLSAPPRQPDPIEAPAERTAQAVLKDARKDTDNSMFVDLLKEIATDQDSLLHAENIDDVANVLISTLDRQRELTIFLRERFGA